jgi:hypothetical protein
VTTISQKLRSSGKAEQATKTILPRHQQLRHTLRHSRLVYLLLTIVSGNAQPNHSRTVSGTSTALHEMRTMQLASQRSVRPASVVAVPSRSVARSLGQLGAPTSRRDVRAAAGGFEGFINQISVAVKNSPLNSGKKALAIAQAGNYNVEETKALLDKYIAENDVGAWVPL